MSKRIMLRETPHSHPRLFQKVSFKDVRPGDIFQGKKDRKKWYKNTDVSQKDSKYTYWRRQPGLSKANPKPTSKSKKPLKSTAAKKVVSVTKAEVVKIVKVEVSRLTPKLEAIVRSVIKKLRITTKIG